MSSEERRKVRPDGSRWWRNESDDPYETYKLQARQLMQTIEEQYGGEDSGTATVGSPHVLKETKSQNKAKSIRSRLTASKERDTGLLAEASMQNAEPYSSVSPPSVENPAESLGEAQLNSGLGRVPIAFTNPRQQRLFELKIMRQQGKRLNNKEVIEESKRQNDRKYEQKEALANTTLSGLGAKIDPGPYKESHGPPTAGDASLQQAEDEICEERQESKKPKKDSASKDYLQESAAAVHYREEKKRKKKEGSFGWDVFNQDSLYRAHKKRLAGLDIDNNAYVAQKQSLGDAFYEKNDFVDFEASTEAKERLAAALEAQLKNRKKFSRRRTYVEDEDISYINERNRIFNRKLDRAFGDYSLETKQNLERGTAL